MAENRREQDDGLYYFSRGQLILVAAGFTVASAAIFLLGILVGQGIEERKLAQKEEPLVKIPVQPSAQGAIPASGKDEITFYDTLTRPPSGTKSAGKEAATETKPAGKAVKPPVKETKAESQDVGAAKAEKAKGKEETERVAAAAEEKRAASAQKGTEAGEVKAQAVAPEGVWTVQVNAFPDERSAQNLVEKLKAKGYDAYRVPTSVKGRTWYRVRVGRLSTRQEARELQENLQTKEKFTKAITVSR